MARINIEDSLLKDDKFTELCIKLGSRILALGTVTESFILAQKFYLNAANDRLIPLNEWQRKKELHVLLDVGMAEQFENGIYIKGSHESFAWILQKQNAGKKSAASKRIKQQTTSTGVQRESTQSNVQQPLTPTLSLTPFSNSNSSSNLICSEPTKSVQNRKPPKPSTEIKFSDSISIKLKDELLHSWRDTFPKEFLQEEFKKARSWVIANDHKTPKNDNGWSRFLNSWLNKGWNDYRKTLKSNPPKMTFEDFEELIKKDLFS